MKSCISISFLLISILIGQTFVQADDLQSSLRLLYSEKKLIRDKAAYQLAKQGGEEARKEFISLIERDTGDLKETAIIALGILEARNTDPQKRKISLDILYSQLKDKNWRIRQAASIALGIIGDERAITHLKKLSRDSFFLREKNSYPVREAAKLALDKIEYLNKLKEIENLWKEGDKRIDKGNLKGSFSFFKQIIAQDKKNRFGFTDDAQFSLGYIYAREGRYKKAISIFNNLLKEYPDFEKTDKLLYCLTLCYLNLKEYKKGKEILLLLKRKFPDSEVTRNSQGLLERLEGLL
ncbi:MAG: HEAT repeat domain-containing protein [Candidatus Omnitrophica bacterium]|nr:HEAT repeat domain-containing protein [Candidatus Omnitrophota bacterium]